MTRYLVSISFDGSNYHGFQRQNNSIGIQEIVERAIKNMTAIPTKIHGSGRTDKGVHAKDLTFHFDSNVEISESLWVRGLNKRLPLDIRVNTVKTVENSFHARHFAVSRVYEYVLSKKPNTAFNQRYLVYIEDFDFNKAKACLKYFVGTKDFRGFSKSDISKDTIKTVYEFNLIETEDNYIFTIKGNSFLRYMVRSIIGTIIDVATNKIEEKIINEIFETNNRSLAGKTAEARGLYLKQTNY